MIGHLNDYIDHFDSGLDDLKDEAKTPLPIPGEYILLQLSPVAMAKHLGKPGLSSALRKLGSRKYLAVLVDVRVAPHSFRSQPCSSFVVQVP